MTVNITTFTAELLGSSSTISTSAEFRHEFSRATAKFRHFCWDSSNSWRNSGSRTMPISAFLVQSKAWLTGSLRYVKAMYAGLAWALKIRILLICLSIISAELKNSASEKLFVEFLAASCSFKGLFKIKYHFFGSTANFWLLHKRSKHYNATRIVESWNAVNATTGGWPLLCAKVAAQDI